jgi:hypothetical protein
MALTNWCIWIPHAPISGSWKILNYGGNRDARVGDKEELPEKFQEAAQWDHDFRNLHSKLIVRALLICVQSLS